MLFNQRKKSYRNSSLFISEAASLFIFHAPKVRFIEKSTCFRKCFFLAPPAGLEPATT